MGDSQMILVCVWNTRQGPRTERYGVQDCRYSFGREVAEFRAPGVTMTPLKAAVML